MRALAVPQQWTCWPNDIATQSTPLGQLRRVQGHTNHALGHEHSKELDNSRMEANGEAEDSKGAWLHTMVTCLAGYAGVRKAVEQTLRKCPHYN